MKRKYQFRMRQAAEDCAREVGLQRDHLTIALADVLPVAKAA